MKYTHTQESGFSLVETFVAITILLIVIVGPMSISSSAARSTSFASEQVIAFFLAQEGVEIVQKSRDDLLLKGFLEVSDVNYEANPWTEFVDNTSYAACFGSAGCGLELNTNAAATLKTPVACTGNNCALYYDDTGERSRYTHASGGNEATGYTRVIRLEETDDRELRVTSRVTWRSGNRSQVQEAVVETYLFNVYGN